MQHELSDTLPPHDTPARKQPLRELPPAHYFDGAGLLWILACVAFAAAAAYFLALTGQPDGLRTGLASIGWHDSAPPTAPLPAHTETAKAAGSPPL